MATVYDEVFEAWRREFQSTDLHSLRPTFFKDVASYVRRLKEAQRNLDQKSLKAVLLEEELERLTKIVGQLVDCRLGKLWDAARNRKVPVEVPEKWLLEEFTEIARHVSRFKEDVNQGAEPSALPERKKDKLVVRFVKDLPAIIGVDLRTHGPFKAEDIANLPFENAESLIRQGAAVEIRPSPQDNE